MIYGKYGEMIFKNMEKNYPIRKQELELTGQLEMKIFEREKIILARKENIEKNMINHCKPQIYDSLYSSTASGLLAQYKSASEKELRQPQIVPLNDKYSTSFGISRKIEN